MAGFRRLGPAQRGSAAAAAGGFVRPGAAGGGYRSLGAGGARISPSRHDHLRRKRRLPHPDHIRCHQVSVAAYEAAADPRCFPDAGEPWAVSKLYYNHGFLRQRMQLLQDEFAKHGQRGPFEKWLAHWDPKHDVFADRVTTRVECSAYFSQRDDALRAHATQIDPDGDFSPLPSPGSSGYGPLRSSSWPAHASRCAFRRPICSPESRPSSEPGTAHGVASFRR